MCTQSVTNWCSVTLVSVKAQSGFIDTNAAHPFSVLLQLWNRKTLSHLNMNGIHQEGYDTVVE